MAAPSLYVSTKLDGQWTVGLGLFVPYGTKLDDDNNWSGRYAMTNAKLESINLNPSFGFKLNEQHSFGFGVSAQFMKAKLGQGVDVPGSIAALNGTPAATALLRGIVAAGGNPAALATINDGHGSMEGQDWGYGWNLGYLFQLDQDTRIGLADILNICKATVWAQAKDVPDFPKPFKLSAKQTRWKLSAVDAYIESRASTQH